jgi:hypothetical protein
MPGILQADTLAAAAERSGKKVAQVHWVGGPNANIAGPTVEFGHSFSNRGALAAPFDSSEKAGAAAFGFSYQNASPAPAKGWTSLPAGDPAAPSQQAFFTLPTENSQENPTRFYDVYIYDSVVDGTPAYDRVILVSSGHSGPDPRPGANPLLLFPLGFLALLEYGGKAATESPEDFRAAVLGFFPIPCITSSD